MVQGIDVGEIRTKPTVRDGIKFDRSMDGLTPEERIGRIIGGMADQKVRFLVYEPGNGTRYDLVIIPLADLYPDPNVDQYLVVLENFGKSMRAMLGGSEHWTYIKSKLGVTTATALTLAELFEYLTTGKNERYGLDKLADYP